MKRVYILILVLLATGFVRSDASTGQDPVKVNAKHITVKVDNPRVRVFEAVLKPGDKENVHAHPATVVYVVEGGKFRNYASDGTTSEVELKAGDTLYRDP